MKKLSNVELIDAMEAKRNDQFVWHDTLRHFADSRYNVSDSMKMALQGRL